MRASASDRRPESFERVVSSMCTEPHPAARRAAERFLASNPGDPETFETVADVERDVVADLGELAGLADARGYVTGGGTEANVQAVRAARNLSDAADPVVVAPDSAHFSFHKAAELLGVDLRTVPTDDDRRADVAATRAAVEGADRVALVVAVAGTTEYGRVDPVAELAAVARDAGARVHVDAAWGGFYLPFSGHEWDFADAPVDTMTIDPHKAGRAAIPAGGLLAREATTLDALAVETPYLESGSQVSLAGTRSGAGVASAAAAMEALWPDGYRDEYERASREAERFAAALRDRGYDPVDPDLPIVAFDPPESAFEALRAAGWKLARTAAGEARVVVMPHVTADTLDALLDDLDRFG